MFVPQNQYSQYSQYPYQWAPPLVATGPAAPLFHQQVPHHIAYQQPMAPFHGPAPGIMAAHHPHHFGHQAVQPYDHHQHHRPRSRREPYRAKRQPSDRTRTLFTIRGVPNNINFTQLERRIRMTMASLKIPIISLQHEMKVSATSGRQRCVVHLVTDSTMISHFEDDVADVLEELFGGWGAWTPSSGGDPIEIRNMSET